MPKGQGYSKKKRKISPKVKEAAKWMEGLKDMQDKKVKIKRNK